MTPSRSARAGVAPRVPSASSGEVLCVGEVLWDALPEGLFLGGAPFNVACHLRAAGVPVSMVSRVGSDQLDDAGNPGYDIMQPSAWDAIEMSESLLARAARARAIVFGTLAQRSEVSR